MTSSLTSITPPLLIHIGVISTFADSLKPTSLRAEVWLCLCCCRGWWW